MISKALYLDPETDDLALDGGQLSLGRPHPTAAHIVCVSNRGELKELPLIGGEATRRLGSTQQELWLVRLRRALTAVGLKVRQLAINQSLNTLSIEVE